VSRRSVHRRPPATDDRWEAVLGQLEPLVNGLSDSDAWFWPFGFLRPPPHRRFSSARVAALSVLCTVPGCLLVLVLDGLLGERALPVHVAGFVAAVALAFFGAYRITFAYFWNRRADERARSGARLKAWQDGPTVGE
jgi:hypothetical protein